MKKSSFESKKEPSIDKGNPQQVGIGPPIAQLIATIEKSSKATIKLTEKIKFLTWILVILGIVMICITVFSL